MNTSKMYLGDGVYIDFDGSHLVVTTENGIDVQNIIYLEQEVFEALFKYGVKKFFGEDAKVTLERTAKNS